MPRWSDAPDRSADTPAFRIVRTPPTRTLTAICTAPEVVGCPTHYVGNRTMPCEGPDHCEPCQNGNSSRWHGYLSAVLLATHEHVLFEFTATASDTFKNFYLAYQSLRGCKFQARRPSGRHNGRVVISCTRIDEREIRLPDPPNIRKILCHVWNIPYQNSSECYGHRPPFKSVKPSGKNGAAK